MGAFPRDVASIAVLTGAGISAESGVPTFRGDGGLWRDYRAEDLATPHAFRRDPEIVWEWYEWRRGLIGACQPNAAHLTLARMENHFDDFVLVTQNVDGLHGLAGSRKAVELHGNIWRQRCTRNCRPAWEDRRVPLPELPPRCPDAGLWPGPTWYGSASRCPPLPWNRPMRPLSAASLCWSLAHRQSYNPRPPCRSSPRRAARTSSRSIPSQHPCQAPWTRFSARPRRRPCHSGGAPGWQAHHKHFLVKTPMRAPTPPDQATVAGLGLIGTASPPDRVLPGETG